jgi:hypothetical protein
MAALERRLNVTRRALVQRINRHLRKRNEALRSTRGANTGEYYRVDISRNVLIEERVALEKLGRELGVLAPYERLAERRS